jgi:hypothetical protein
MIIAISILNNWETEIYKKDKKEICLKTFDEWQE